MRIQLFWGLLSVAIAAAVVVGILWLPTEESEYPVVSSTPPEQYDGSVDFVIPEQKSEIDLAAIFAEQAARGIEVPDYTPAEEIVALDDSPLGSAEFNYEEDWREFVASLDLTPVEQGQVRDILIRHMAREYELNQMLANDEIAADALPAFDVTEALSSILSDDQVDAYLAEAEAQRKAVFEELVQYEFGRLNNGEVGILDATANNDTLTVQAYVNSGANVDMMSLDGTSTPLLNAVVNDNFEMAQMLLAAGASPNLATTDEFQATPLGDAAVAGRVEIVRLLIEHGADPDGLSTGWLPLDLAAHHGHTDVVAYLLDYGVAPTSDALYWALFNENRDMEQTLTNAGAPEDSKVRSIRGRLRNE